MLITTEDMLRAADYVGEKTALAAAQKTLDLPAQLPVAGPMLISHSRNALSSVDDLTHWQAAVNAVNTTLEDVQHHDGGEKIGFDGVMYALGVYKCSNDALFEDVNKAIADLMQLIEYAAFQTTTTGLALAHGCRQGFERCPECIVFGREERCERGQCR